MAIGVAGGNPQYSGNFVPEKWSSKILVKFYEQCCLAAISNTDYEGEIKNQGDVVKIRKRPDVTIRKYYKTANLIHQYPDEPLVEFPIDQANYFDFIVDDIDVYQSDIKIMSEFSEDAGHQMKEYIEEEQFGLVYADADSNNSGTTAGRISGDIDLGTTASPRVITKADIVDLIVDCRTVLRENKISSGRMYMVIPEWMAGMILKSEVSDSSMMGDGKSRLLNGRLGILAEFEIFSSNLLTSVSDSGYTCYHALAGQEKAISFASQLTKMQHIDKPESGFHQIVRGLNVYGCKVLKGEAICDVYVRNGG